MKINRNLEHSYKTFVDQKKPFDFFKGLAEYLEYVFSVPVLKKTFDEQLAERRVLYKQIENTEKTTREELDKAKLKLLALIKKIKVDVMFFVRYRTWAFNENSNILQELGSFEKGKPVSSVFLSDEIEKYLFDIAANLLKAGHEKKLREFLVSPEKYGMYHLRIYGPSQYLYMGSPYGNFIFSKTWPERWEKVTYFEHERILKPWGSFEILSQFNIAYKLAKTKIIDSELIAKGGTENTSWFGGEKERAKIYHMAHEIQRLVESQLDFHSMVSIRFKKVPIGELKDLDQVAFKNAVQTAHSILMRVASEIASDPSSERYWIVKDGRTGNFYFNSKEVLIKSEAANYVKIFKIVFDLEPTGGKVTYKKIGEIGRQHKPKLMVDSKKVQRALTGNDATFFKYVTDIPLSSPEGKPFFTALQNGKELEFRNKR